SVLFLIGFGSFFYFANALPDEKPGGPIALNPTLPQADENGKTASAQVAQATPPSRTTTPAEEGKEKETRPPATAAAEGPKGPADTPRSGLPADANENTLALPIPKMELFQPRTPDVALPLIQKFAELDIVKLKEELQKDSGFRLELPCGES